MNELLGIIATVSEVTQNSAGVVGNSIKTVLSRMSNVKAGVSVDENGEALNDVEKTLNRIGISLRDNQGEWRDFYDVLDEVANKWDSLSSTQQSQITTALGGTRQRENILVALENWDKVRQYAETGANAQGTAMEKYDIILESVSAKQEQLNAKVQEFYSNILNNGFIAGLLDFAKVLMDITNLGDGLVGKIGLMTLGFVGLNIVLSACKSMLVEYAMKQGVAVTSEIAHITSLGALKLAFKGLGLSIASTTKAILNFLVTNPVGWAMLAVGAIAGVVAIFNAFNVTLEEQHEKAQEAQEGYQEIANELKTVNDELITTKQRIEELEKKDSLTFVEQEELKKLKETNAELESQAYWLKKAEEEKKKEVNDKASKAWEKDFNKSGEYSSRYNKTTTTTQKYDPYTMTYSTETAQTPQSITEEQYIKEQIQYLGELKTQIDEVKNAEGEWANATTEQRETELERLRGLKTGVEEYLTGVGTRIQNDFLDSYDVSDDVKQSWLDLQDIIRMAIDPDYTVKKFEEAFEKLPNTIKDNLKDAENAGNFKSLEEAFTVGEKVDTTNLEKFKDALKAIGIEADDPTVLNYLNSIANATDSINVEPLMSYSQVINDVKDKVEVLDKAQKEMSDSGYLTADTVVKLESQFGDLSGYLTLTANGYQISKAGLDALNNSMLVQYETALNEAKAGAQNIINQEIEKGRQIDNTNLSIQEQMKLLLELARADYSKASLNYYNEQGAYEFHRTDEGKKMLDEIQNINNAYTSVQNAQKNYDRAKASIKSIKASSKSGSGSKSSSSSSKEWWETELEKLKDQFDNNEITMNTYINGLESLLGKVKKSSDAWRKINKELQKAKLDNLENQFKRGEITIDEYIKGLERLRKSYKKNTEEYKELTKTINETKADKFADQYERAEISLNSYIKALTSLRNEYKKNSEEWKKYNDLINETKYDAYTERYERGSLSADTYVKLLKELQKQYKQGSEMYYELADAINDALLDKTEKWIDKLDKSIDEIEQKIHNLGDVNTASEQVKYAKLLSEKYNQVIQSISIVQNQLKKTNLTDEQRVAWQEELNELLEEEVSIRDEIEDTVREYYENQKEQLEQQTELKKKQVLYEKEIELYGEQGKDLYEHNMEAQIKLLEEKQDALDKVNEREELENDLLEAKLKLQNALNNKTTKILTKQADGSWQYTFSANMAEVKSAREDVESAQKALDDYDLQKQIDDLNDAMSDLADQYEEAEFWAEREYEKTINSIEKVYGDIDSLVQDWMNVYGTNTQDLTKSYQSLVKANNSLKDSLTSLEIAINSQYETVGYGSRIKTKDGVKSFDTGGEISGSGLALVHDKERVLTQEQNINFMKFLDNIDNLKKIIDVSKVSLSHFRLNKNNVEPKSNEAQTVINGVTCVFPNITSSDGIQKAILDLPRVALQRKK